MSLHLSRRWIYALSLTVALLFIWWVSLNALWPEIPWGRESWHTIGLQESEAIRGNRMHFPPLASQWDENIWRMSLTELQDFVNGTNGYYVRDWSLGLGWNNMRYIIEAALLHAKLLNRVLVLPSFVFVRACEFPTEVCSAYADFVHRHGVVGWGDDNPGSPYAWHLPITVMLDFPHLRESYQVILASEFYELHGLDPTAESSSGAWNVEDHETLPLPSLHIIPNEEYDPSDIVRVDTLEDLPEVTEKNQVVDETLRGALEGGLTLNWDDAVQALKARGLLADPDVDVTRVIESGGWITTHTFIGDGGQDYTKAVANPLKQVVPRTNARGLVDDYSHVKEGVLLLQGEIHLNRKPGSLRFTTESARDDFGHLVLFGVQPVRAVRELAKVLAGRMKELCGGRQWMAAHMRRGDFVILGWGPDRTIEGQLARVRARLDVGRETLGRILETTSVNDTDMEPDARITLPRKGDLFFIATDERDPLGLDVIRSQSGVLLEDLLEKDDRRGFGWPLMFTDVMALVEQNLAAQSSFFYGHSLSSFAGGVHNLRAARGADPRTTLID